MGTEAGKVLIYELDYVSCFAIIRLAVIKNPGVVLLKTRDNASEDNIQGWKIGHERVQ